MPSFSDLLGLTISVGAISSIEHRVSEALAPAVEQARRHIQCQDAANIGETGFRGHNAKAWLWVVVAGAVTLFQVARSRGSKVARELLGESFGGIVGSDRWSGYTWIDPFQRQPCWAHLSRDFQAFVDRRGHSYAYGVDPTNNIAERAVRKGVLWRKTSFGTQAERGSRFVERMLTVVETCRCQGRDVLGYVTAAVQAATEVRPAPSLLPAQDNGSGIR